MELNDDLAMDRSVMRRFWLGVWDFLVLVLIIFPLVTGGIWISRPGLFIELSDLAVPVLIVAFVGSILHIRGISLLESRSAILATKLWSWWAKSIEKSPGRTIGWVAFLNGCIWLTGSIKRYLEVNQYQMDLTIFVNTIWNLTHGNGYVSSVKGGINLLLDHQSPIFWLFAPAFALIPHAATLLTIQAFAVSAGGLAVFGIAKQFLEKDHWLTSASPLLYWAYLPVRNAVGFDFHPETLMLPLFLFGILGCQSGRRDYRAIGCLLLILALAAKESAPVVMMGIALGWALGAGPERSRRFTRFLGFALTPISVAVFWFDTQWIPHALGARSYAYQGEYQALGGSLTGILLSPFLHPREFWARMLRPSRFKFLLWTLGPLAFLPLFHPKRFLAAIPPYLMLFLSKGDTRVHIGFHYGIETAVGLFWALPGKIPYLSRKAAVVGSLFFALVLFGRSEIARIRFYDYSEHAQWLLHDLIPCVDPGVSLSASVALSSHLATRKWISLFPQIHTSSGLVSCIIYDPNIVNVGISPSDTGRVLQGAIEKYGFHESLRCSNGVQVLERGSENCLRCIPRCD